jgi:hypothetical protein
MRISKIANIPQPKIQAIGTKQHAIRSPQKPAIQIQIRKKIIAIAAITKA